MQEIVISTQQLCKEYNGLFAVRNATIDIKKGEIYGLVGRNGAGKTTLIRLLMGLIKPSSGGFEIKLAERNDTTIAAIVEKAAIYPDMTGIDNLCCQCRLLGIAEEMDYLVDTLKLVGLNPESKLRAKFYSLGMRQRLAIAMTLVGKPQLLILDEPTNGLDPQGIQEMRELFVRLNQERGISLVISSHILAELSKFATQYIFMEKGKIVQCIDKEQLASLSSKAIRLTVDSVLKATAVLKEAGYTVLGHGENVIDITDQNATPTELLLKLSENGISVTSIENTAVDLENYFINLVGGKNV